MTESRHNRSAARRSELTLSEEPSSKRNARECRHPIPASSRRDVAYCSSACRQAAYRARRAERPFVPGRPRLAVVHGSADAAATDRTSSLLPARPVQLHGLESVARPSERRAANASSAVVRAVPAHLHDDRLCAVCMADRLAAIRPAPRARVNATSVAAAIARGWGDVWGPALAYGISYEHALRIRRGWRGAGRVVDAIPYRARGYYGDRLGSRKPGSPIAAILRAADRGMRSIDGQLLDSMLDAMNGGAT